MSDNNEPRNITAQVIALVAFCGGIASVVIALIAFGLMRPITDAGMFAIALTVAAPSAMAFGICYALIKHGKSQ